VRFILVKGNDVSTYVEEGIADIGITGSDILDEKDKLNVNNLVDLPFGYCHFAVASKPEVTEYKKIATTYVKTTKAYFKNKGQDVSII
ncbi:ATP phosphoribosyltransferase, partial [Staphylococcus saprophyticus]